jgi:hypothetical protein
MQARAGKIPAFYGPKSFENCSKEHILSLHSSADIERDTIAYGKAGRARSLASNRCPHEVHARNMLTPPAMKMNPPATRKAPLSTRLIKAIKGKKNRFNQQGRKAGPVQGGRSHARNT